MAPLTSWVFVVLLANLQEAHGLTSFPDNVVVAENYDDTWVTLTCDSATPGAVTWKFEKHGEVEEVVLEPNFKQDGRHLNVRLVEAPMVGEYSCWSGETKLSSAYLVIKAEEIPSDSMLSCRATSYNCAFSCHWSHAEYTTVRLGMGHDCATGEKTCPWVSSSSQHPQRGSQFELSHSLTPYTEEDTMIKVTAEAMNDYYFQRTTKSFYLRDIIKPERPRIAKCQEVGQELNVTIEPASSWSMPHSYFILEHEIEYVYRDNGEKGYSTSHLIPKEISKLRVRSRDSLVLSDWSQWTPWTNVRKNRTPMKNCCKKSKKAKDQRKKKNH